MCPSSSLLRRRCAAVLAVMTLSNAACSAWHIQDVTPAARLATGHPGTVRVTRTDGSQIILDSAVVRSDTLLGFVSAHVQPSVAIPLANVQQVETLGFSAGRTFGLFAGFGVAVLAAIAIILGSCTGACAS
jgi:hypothetical protein